MPKTAYPTFADVRVFLDTLGVPVPDALAGELGEFAADAAAEWESQTGWLPYLAAHDAADATVPSTRLFDPPGPRAGQGFASGYRGGRLLDLGAGLLSLTGLNVSGTAYSPGLDFWLRPNNAPAQGEPYTEVEFLSPAFGLPQSIAVTGIWGRTLSLEDDVWSRIREYAAALCAPALQGGLSGGVVQVKTQTTQTTFATGGGEMPLMTFAAGWEAKFARTARRKKRVTV